MKTILYRLLRIDGDYAILSDGEHHNPVARALLPAEADEGDFLRYEHMEYTLCSETGEPK